ncbi:glycoside hydrolase [candidate division KSB1 bacterium]|nr:glycoside hydrolase [candidate division KSB1 bacterium]
MKTIKLVTLCLLFLFNSIIWPNTNITSLNGEWEIGENRQYNRTIMVPGVATDPKKMNDDTLWYRRKITLPGGQWKYATLLLRGARFMPEVYINGKKVSQQNGGMAPTVHFLNHPAVKPDATVTLEIALKSLKDVPETDASYVAKANHWRSNVSSYIWNDVILKTHGEYRISRIIPFTDIKKDQVRVNWELENLSGSEKCPSSIVCEITDLNGNVIVGQQSGVDGLEGSVTVPFRGKCRLWTPEEPNLYKLKLTLKNNEQIIDTEEMSYGVKEFTAEGIEFHLNGYKYPVRMGTVVWHRWSREEEARTLIYDNDWFRKNVVQRLKDHGANALRFHQGNPPEAFLDMCDEYGLLVQNEWSFFHDMPASEESLLEQWQSWFDVAMKHPSICLFHPYDETYGEQLKIAWSALDKLLKDYPPLVLEDRDITYIHKYWWSLFENVGLYYDSASQFDKPIMVDEFGGIALEGDWSPAAYPAVKRSLLRFLGRDHTVDMRINIHTIANSQIAEYWRRIGAAGFSPFNILGCYEDGSHWFVGDIKEGNPKPAWDAMTAAYSPVSVSLEIWDRNYVANQKVEVPVYLFNDFADDAELYVKISIVNQDEKVLTEQILSEKVAGRNRVIKNVTFDFPAAPGRYTIRAQLTNPPESVKYPVISQWEFRVFKVKVPEEIKNVKIGVPEDENEIKDFLTANRIAYTSLTDKNADMILTSRKTWEKLEAGDKILNALEKAIQNGKSVILLDAGPLYLGQGYPKDSKDLGFLQGVNKIENPEMKEIDLVGGVKLSFQQIAEPESHIHPSEKNNELWYNLEWDYSWLWNGYRGGLIVPAMEMEFSGLSQDAFISHWVSRGADRNLISSDSYYAYELEGFYSFSVEKDDPETKKKLREKVKFLVEDAPALAISIDPDARMQTIDLVQGYTDCLQGKAENFIPLVNCGIDLYRTPAVRIDFGRDRGSLLVSQLLTSGRLAKGYGQDGLYGVRYDEVAGQFVLNMLRYMTMNK